MANDIGNELWVRGPQDELERFMEAVRDVPPLDQPDAVFDEDSAFTWLSLRKLKAYPDDLPSGYFDPGTEEGMTDFLTWQRWVAENWGTKWIIGVDVRWLSANELYYRFCSAWSPPDSLLDFLAKRFPRLSFALDATDLNMDSRWRGEWREGRRVRYRSGKMSSVKRADVILEDMWACQDDENFESLLEDYRAAYPRLLRKHEMHYKCGLVYLEWEKYEEAVAEFTEAIRRPGGNAAAYTRRAVAYRHLGRYEQANANHSQAIRLAPDDPEAHFEQGMTHWQEQCAEALTEIHRSVGLNGYFAPGHAMLADLYSYIKRYDAAREHLVRAIEVHPTCAHYQRDYADLLCLDGEYERAALHYTTAMRVSILGHSLLLPRGVCFLLLNRADRADQDFQALVKKCSFSKALTEAGRAFSRLTAALAKGRESAIGRCRKIIARLVGDRWDQREAIFAWHHYAAALREQGARQIGRGVYACAARNLGRAVRAAPDDPDAHLLLAWLQATCADDAVRDGPKALRHARRARRLRKDADFLTLTVLAAAFAETGNFEQAVRKQQEAIALAAGASLNGLLATRGRALVAAGVLKLSPKVEMALPVYRRRLALYRAGKCYRLPRRRKGRKCSDGPEAPIRK